VYASDRGAGEVLVIDPGSGSVLDTLTVEAGPTTGVLDPVRNRLYLMNEEAGAITVIEGAAAVGEERRGSRRTGLAIVPSLTRRFVLLRLESADRQAQVRLFDATGREVSAGRLGPMAERSGHMIDLSGCAAGVYVLRVRADGRDYQGRVVKSN
jgi:DNA-binding beta-propeller fold protein YncE